MYGREEYQGPVRVIDSGRGCRLTGYGWTCFGCQHSLDILVPEDYLLRNHEAIDAHLRDAGWGIGHFDGQGQFVCPCCYDCVWDAALIIPLGELSQ